MCVLLFYKIYFLNYDQHPEQIKWFSIETFGKSLFDLQRFQLIDVILEQIIFKL